MQLASVRYVVSVSPIAFNAFEPVFSAPQAYIYSFHTLPRIRLVHQAEGVDSFADAASELASPSFNVAEEGVIEGQVPKLSPAVAPEPLTVEERRDRTTVTVDASADALLLDADTWYPGWIATLDGREVPVLRANGIFRGVAVPQGRHTIVIAYQSRVVQFGIGITIVSLLVIIALFARFPMRGICATTRLL